MLTWKYLLASHIMVSESSVRNVIYAFSLRQKFSSKVTRLIGILLLNASTGLMFIAKGIDWHWWHQVFQGRINLFNKALGTKLLLVEEALSDWVNVFGEGLRTSLVDVYSCLGVKSLGRMLDNNLQKWYLLLQREEDKFPFKTRLGRGNLFILINNIIIIYLELYNRCHIL